MRQISSTQHPIVKHLAKLRQNRDYRYEHHSLVVEGAKMVAELGRHARFKTVMALSEAHLPLDIKAEEIFLANESIMKKISGVQSMEGIIAEIAMPVPAKLKGKKFLIALDGVNDPGNEGNILRTALALGWEGAYILEDSCDPFNEKAIRAARGATFRLPLAWGGWDQLKQLIKENNLKPVAADLHGKNFNEIKGEERLLLVLGNEARGLSDEAKQICQPITIAMPGEMESLNVSVAAGILMYGLRK